MDVSITPLSQAYTPTALLHLDTLFNLYSVIFVHWKINLLCLDDIGCNDLLDTEYIMYDCVH